MTTQKTLTQELLRSEWIAGPLCPSEFLLGALPLDPRGGLTEQEQKQEGRSSWTCDTGDNLACLSMR